MYTVEVKNKDTTVFDVKARENTMAIEPMGKGFAPSEVLLASLGSCIGYFIRAYAKQAKLELKQFTIRLESDFVREKTMFGMKELPMAMRDIKVQIDLEGARLDPQRKEALMRFIGNCPIKATLEHSPRIQINI
jgi:putative redox protein